MVKKSYFMNYAIDISKKANCIKGKVGAVLVKNNEIIAEGVNSVPEGIEPCTEETCIRKIKIKEWRKPGTMFCCSCRTKRTIRCFKEKD